MGSCIDRERQTKVISRSNGQPIRSESQQHKGIVIQQGVLSTLQLNHKPLESCQFLFNKFKAESNKPEEVNLAFMVVSIEVDESENLVKINFINENQVNIYFVLGGEEGVSITGLTVDFKNVKYVQKINRKNATAEGNPILLVPAKLEQDKITIIMEPILSAKQSMYLIYRYVYDVKGKKYIKKSQSLQWNNLAFNIQEIFGAQNQFKCNSGQLCSICITSPSNIIFTPCRHMCICNECSKAHKWKTCPICRSEVRALIQYV